MSEFERDLESELTAELRRRSRDVLPAERLVARARRRARVVQRRRRLAVGTVTAAALAVAVPTALSFQGVPQTEPWPAGTPTVAAPKTPQPEPTRPSQAPSPTPSSPSATVPHSQPPPPSTEPDEQPEQPPSRGGSTALSLDDLPMGAPPSIGWVERSTFHRTDGRQVEIPDTMFAPLDVGVGVVGAMSGPEDWTPSVAFLDASGTVTATYQGDGPVVSSDHSLIAWYDKEASQLVVSQGDGGGTGPGGLAVPDDQQLEPVGFLEPDTLVSNISTETELWAGARRDTFTPGSTGATSTTPPWDVIAVAAVSQAAQLVVGYTEITDSGSCSAVYEADADEPLWSTCEYSFDHFSPDGRHLVGSNAYRDGEGAPFAVVVDARTGEVVHTYTGWFVTGTAFEDESHVLINLRVPDGADRRAALVRCGFDGACELATPILQVGDVEPGYGLGLQP